MKLPLRVAESKALNSNAVAVRDADGTWICDTWRHVADELVAAANGRTAPEGAYTAREVLEMNAYRDALVVVANVGSGHARDVALAVLRDFDDKRGPQEQR